MLNTKMLFLGLVVSVLLSGVALNVANTASATTIIDKESAYDRVMRTGVLRCGFFEEAPFTNIDPNTNKKSGIAVELAENMAAQLGLKIEWTPLSLATLVTDLETGRYDTVCASAFNIPRAGRVDYTTPYIYVPSRAYVRKGDSRFDGNLDRLNDSNYTMAILDGEGSTTIAQRLYPKAKQSALPQNAQISEMLLAVSSKKADIAFVLPSVFQQFEKNNPGVLQEVKTKNPFYVFSVSFAVRAGEVKLKNMFDFMIKQMVVSGEMDRLVDKYEEVPNTFLRVQKPYR
jgi:ABC-type amino acid transport substrate-binding protein